MYIILTHSTAIKVIANRNGSNFLYKLLRLFHLDKNRDTFGND